jgi:hypothetical protein
VQGGFVVIILNSPGGDKDEAIGLVDSIYIKETEW